MYLFVFFVFAYVDEVATHALPEMRASWDVWARQSDDARQSYEVYLRLPGRLPKGRVRHLGKRRRLDQSGWVTKGYASMGYKRVRQYGLQKGTPVWVTKGNTSMGYKRVRQYGSQKGTPVWVTKGNTSMGHKREHQYGLQKGTPVWVTKGYASMGHKRVRQYGSRNGTPVWVTKGYASMGCKGVRQYGL